MRKILRLLLEGNRVGERARYFDLYSLNNPVFRDRAKATVALSRFDRPSIAPISITRLRLQHSL